MSIFLTTCTHNRDRAFVDASFAEAAAQRLLQLASRLQVAIPAYCLMPDHAHVLVAAQESRAEPLTAFLRWKQWTGYEWRKRTGSHLWQESYWDYVLRHDEQSRAVAAYIVNNPVRAGLVPSVVDYPHSGSSQYTLTELAEAAQVRPRSGRG